MSCTKVYFGGHASDLLKFNAIFTKCLLLKMHFGSPTGIAFDIAFSDS